MTGKEMEMIREIRAMNSELHSKMTFNERRKKLDTVYKGDWQANLDS